MKKWFKMSANAEMFDRGSKNVMGIPKLQNSKHPFIKKKKFQRQVLNGQNEIEE